ncbi:MAG: hypothetical protein WAU88_12440 [Candidatus Zixiibacteriota bacterium]
MQPNGQVTGRTVLFSLILLIAPMVAFPHQFGTPLLRVAPLYGFAELALYFVAALVMFRGQGMYRVISATVGFGVYRVALGAVLAVLIIIMYPISFGSALRLSLISYVPAVFLHILATPFVLKAQLDMWFGAPEKRHRPISRETIAPHEAPTSMSSIVISKNKGVVTESRVSRPPVDEDTRRPAVDIADAVQNSASPDLNGFERATRYLGEHGSVFLAAVVDNEGLLLGHFKRGAVVAEDLAPLALMFMDTSRRVLDRAHLAGPEKIDITLKDKRLLVAKEASFSLMVLAERMSDDTLGIRFNQAMEMVRRWYAERYTVRQTVNAERIHVSSIE